MPGEVVLVTFPFRSMLAAPLLIGLGCSSGSFTIPEGGDATSDAADAAPLPDAQPDAPTTEAGPLECKDPSQCGSLKPHCCATFDLGAGSLPSCPLSNTSTSCKAVCDTQIPLACPSSGRVKLCRDSKDCVSDAQNPKCCKILASGVIGSFCVSDLVASYSMSCN